MRPRARSGVASAERWSHSRMTARSSSPRRGSSSEPTTSVSPALDRHARRPPSRRRGGAARPSPRRPCRPPTPPGTRWPRRRAAPRSRTRWRRGCVQMRRQAESSTCRGSRLAPSSRLELVEQPLAARAGHELDVALLEVAVDARVVDGRGRLVGKAARQLHLLLGEAAFALGLADHEHDRASRRRTAAAARDRSSPPIAPSTRGSPRPADGSDTVSSTGSGLKRISRSLGRSSSRMNVAVDAVSRRPRRTRRARPACPRPPRTPR